MNKRILFILAMCAPSWAAPTQTVPWVTETTTHLAWKAIEDDNGGFYLLWTHQDMATLRVLGQHITAQGTPLWTSPGQTCLSVIPDTAAWTAFSDSDKGLAMAWVMEGKVFVQRWTANGEPLWKVPVQVSNSSFISGNPAGIADGGGGLYVLWTEKITGNRSVLMAQHLNAQAVPVWPTTIRVSLRPSDQRHPVVAFDGAAGMIISWADYRDLSSDWRVQRINFQGFRLWGLEGIEMAAPAGSGSSALRIAPWGQGSLTVAWVDGENGRNLVQDRQISPQGVPLADKKLPSALTGDQWNPVLTGDGEGHYWVGWEDNRNEQNWKIYLRHGGPDMPLSSTTSGDQGQLALAEDSTQGVYAAWIENRASGPSLYAQHLASDGRESWDPSGREIAANVKHPNTPSMLLLDSEHAAVFWADQPAKGQTALYWQILP
jgi:hypothetical protein